MAGHPERQEAVRVRHLTELANHPNKRYRLIAVKQLECPPDLLRMLSDDEWNKIREAVASHPHCPSEVLGKLAEDRTLTVRGQVAAHPSCPQPQLEQLATDRFKKVRRTVAENPSCPPPVRSTLAEESETPCREAEFVCGSRQTEDIARLYQLVHPLRELARWSDEGDPDAQLYLAITYKYGRMVPEDHDLAMKWYAEAAENGNGEAQVYVGDIYRDGLLGVEEDVVTAYAFYELGAANGLDEAMKRRENLAAKMSVRQIAEAETLARDCDFGDLKRKQCKNFQ